MLLFDLSNSSPNALARAQEAARQFVTQNVQGNAQSSGVTALVFQLDPADAVANSLDVTVHKKGVADARKVSVAIEQ